VSEVEDWILVDLVHYVMEMERSLLLMMEHLFAKHSEEMEAKAEARQEKADAKIEARLERMEATMHSMWSDIERSLHQQMEALLEGSRSFGTRTTICRLPPVACPDNSEGDVIISNRIQKKWMPQDWLIQRKHRPQRSVRSSKWTKPTWTLSGHRRTDLDINAWPYDVAKRLRTGSKTVLGPGRSCLLPASESYVAPSLQCARDRCVKVQERTTL
jgi:hypothetical protein